MLFTRCCLAALSDLMISSNLESVELRIKLTLLSTNLTEEVPICIDTIPSLNFKLAFCLRRKASPRFKSWLRYFITIGALRIGLSMFSIYIKKGLVLSIISTGWPATAVPAVKEHGETVDFNCFASFSLQMVPNKLPLSTSVFTKVFVDKDSGVP